MKIYFGFTVAGNRSSLAAARKIVSVLVEMGHEVLTSHLISDDTWEADRRIAPREVYERDMNWLCECDLFLGEVSGSSFGLGFEAGYLLGATSKPVLLFYAKEYEAMISLLITGNSHPNCRLSAYSDLEEIKGLLVANFAQLGLPPQGRAR
jgi:hypothetical protein